MTTLRHKVFIHAAPESVWEALADLESVRHYNPLAHRVTITTPQRAGPGAARRCDGPQGAFCERVAAWDPGRSITIELTESGWPVAHMRWTTEVRPDAAGTLMLQATEYEPKFGMAGRVLDRLVLRRKLDAGIRDVFSRFRAHVETTAPGLRSERGARPAPR